MEWTWLLVLAVGFGLGSAAAAWATRRPEYQVTVGTDVIQFADPPSEEQVERFREVWERMNAKGRQLVSEPTEDDLP